MPAALGCPGVTGLRLPEGAHAELDMLPRAEELEDDSMSESDTSDDGESDVSEVSTVHRPKKAKGGAKGSASGGASGTASRPKLRTLHRWSNEEHKNLQRLIAKYGTERNWTTIATFMPGRTGKQCRERWLNHLREGIVK